MRPIYSTLHKFTPTYNMSLFPRFVSHEMRPFFRMLEDPFFNPAAATNQLSRRVFQPKFDVHETKDAYHLEGEVAGVTNKNVDIQFTDAQTLVVKGRIERSITSTSPEETTTNDDNVSETSAVAEEKPRKPTVEDEADATKESTAAVVKQASQDVQRSENHGPKVWVSERVSGEFQRSFSFPATIDQDAVKASLKDGILSIVVPKREMKGSKKINVE